MKRGDYQDDEKVNNFPMRFRFYAKYSHFVRLSSIFPIESRFLDKFNLGKVTQHFSFKITDHQDKQLNEQEDHLLAKVWSRGNTNNE